MRSTFHSLELSWTYANTFNQFRIVKYFQIRIDKMYRCIGTDKLVQPFLGYRYDWFINTLVAIQRHSFHYRYWINDGKEQ